MFISVTPDALARVMPPYQYHGMARFASKAILRATPSCTVCRYEEFGKSSMSSYAATCSCFRILCLNSNVGSPSGHITQDDATRKRDIHTDTDHIGVAHAALRIACSSCMSHERLLRHQNESTTAGKPASAFSRALFATCRS